MITSLENKTIKQLRKLHQKKYRQDQFLILEDELIQSARESGYLKKLVYWGEAPFFFEESLEVSKEVFYKIAMREDRTYLGVSSMVEEKDYYGKRILILDHLQDPLNIGRIMEAAQLFGFDSLIFSFECAEIYNEKCLANCKGGIYSLNLCHKDLKEEIPALQKKGYKVYATGLSEDTLDMHEVRPEEKMAFIMGNEGSGVTKELMDLSDGVMKIDMHNIDSLNVGMAASIIMYQFRSGQ